MDLLRFSTAGSVDDGKSTLIGRLLYDSKSIFEDQLDALKRSSELHGDGTVNLALLTDGLRAEREQGITIDVAYRYFATPRRKFIIADTPGHVQYTRNMVTGASTAELAIVLIDARKGVLTQSRRHGFIASLLQIPHMIVAVNKMDLVDYSEEVFHRIVDDYDEFARKLEVANIAYIPISALAGDNVVDKSERMPWYGGPTLLHYLETVKVGAEHNVVDFRFPVQYVVRPNQDFRGFAGQVASGSITPGEEVLLLPSNRTSRVRSIVAFEEERSEARSDESVIITLEDEIELGRGGMIVRSRNRPTVTTTLDADLCWMSETAMVPEKLYVLQHTSRQVSGTVSQIIYKLDVDTLHRSPAETFELNDVGRVEIRTAQPVFIDSYRINRRTGAFILLDPDTNTTVAAGMIRGVAQNVEPVPGGRRSGAQHSPNVVWEGVNVTREERESRNGHRAAVIWFTGLSGSGKTTIARAVERRLFGEGRQTMLLDGDHLRHGLTSDLGFTPEDRAENVRRVGEVAKLFYEQGSVTLCTFISPYRKDRDAVRQMLPDGSFFEIFVDADIEVCRRRDPKGHYARAEAGELPGFTGVSSPYEPPEHPELVLRSETQSLDDCVETVLRLLQTGHILP